MSVSENSQGCITLYDFPIIREGETVSPFVWLVRLALNHKGLAFKTEWVEFPDIREVSIKLGVEPTIRAFGEELYTVPLLVDSTQPTADGKPAIIADSFAIVKYLDKTYPGEPIIPKGTEALQAIWRDFILANIARKFVPIAVPRTPAILSERSKEYFIEARTRWLGPLDKLCPDESKAWAELQAGFDKIAKALDENGTDGEKNVTVIPGQIGYADFALVGMLLWAAAIVPKEKMDEVKSWNDGRWGKMMDLSKHLLK